MDVPPQNWAPRSCFEGEKVDLGYTGAMVRFAVPCLVVLGWSTPALAEEAAERRVPPPSSFDYLQYGVAFAAETVASAGDVCQSTAVDPCILGSGGGLTVRVG